MKKTFLIMFALITVVVMVIAYVYIDGKKDVDKIESEIDKEIDNLFKENSKYDCVQDWECDEWKECLDNRTSRFCYDLNDCEDEFEMPVLEKECIEGVEVVACIEDWVCDNWTDCINSSQIAICEDKASCGIEGNKPNITRECASEEDSSVAATVEEACIAKNKNSVYYNDSMICISNHVDDIFDVEFDGKMISCCIGDVVKTPEEACAVDGEIYFNSSYDCTMYSTMDFGGTDINCCKKTPFLKYVVDSELSNAWNAMSLEEDCSINLSIKLSDCAKYRCSFDHPFGGVYEKGVVFERENLCYYYEEMPNNGVYLCQYDSINLAGAVKYWDDVYTLGEYNDTFANEMLDIGACQMLGYE